MRETVAVLGASDRPERVSYRAQQLLLSRGHKPLLVNPRLREIEGLPCYPDLRSVGEAVHTITVYLVPDRK